MSGSIRDSDSFHTLALLITDATDWNHVEEEAASIIRRYFALPTSGVRVESRQQLLVGAAFKGTQRGDRFDATVEVTR